MATTWGGELSDARRGLNDVNDGLILKELETIKSIESTSYIDANSFALDIRGRTTIPYQFDNSSDITDGVFRILGTQKQYDNISDLDESDFTITIVPEDINFGPTIKATIDLTTPLDHVFLTGVLVQFKKVVGNWNLSGHLKVK